MARAKSIGIRETLTSVLPRAELERLPCESGMVRRRRKVDPSAMLWTLALGFGTGRERTLAGLRRMYQRATGTSLVPSAFYDRFTPELVRFLRRVVGELCGRLSEHEPARSGLLAKFADVMVADATVVKRHRLLAKRYPGTRTNSSPAAAKLHLVMSVTGRGVERVKLTGERANDHRTLRMGPWVRNRLLVFDLGFFRYQLFDCIDRNGGYFLPRLPASANPCIVGVHRRWRGRAVELEGRRLDEVADRLKREILDVEVEVEFQRRVYAGRRRMDRRRLRLVGVRDADNGSYWFYLTNIAPEDLDANDLAQLYACRWQVELVFKELKSHYRFDELPTRKAPVVEALLLASIITLLASRRLLDAVRRRLRRLRQRIPEGRWASLFASAASHILDLILLAARTARALARRLEPMLVHRSRGPQRIQTSTAATRRSRRRVGPETDHECQAAQAGRGLCHRLRSFGDAHFVPSEVVSRCCPSLSGPAPFVQSHATDGDMIRAGPYRQIARNGVDKIRAQAGQHETECQSREVLWKEPVARERWTAHHHTSSTTRTGRSDKPAG